MSFRDPSGHRAFYLPHPDRALYDPPPGTAIKDAWASILFDRDIAALSAALQRQRDFREKDSSEKKG